MKMQALNQLVRSSALALALGACALTPTIAQTPSEQKAPASPASEERPMNVLFFISDDLATGSAHTAHRC